MDYINAKFGDFGRAKGLEVFKVRKALILRSRDFNPVGNFTQMFNFTLDSSIELNECLKKCDNICDPLEKAQCKYDCRIKRFRDAQQIGCEYWVSNPGKRPGTGNH